MRQERTKEMISRCWSMSTSGPIAHPLANRSRRFEGVYNRWIGCMKRANGGEDSRSGQMVMRVGDGDISSHEEQWRQRGVSLTSDAGGSENVNRMIKDRDRDSDQGRRSSKNQRCEQHEGALLGQYSSNQVKTNRSQGKLFVPY